jgi:hypothetical protein
MLNSSVNNSYPLGVDGRHERAERGEILVHLLAAVALDGNVGHPLALRLLLVLDRPGPPPLPPLRRWRARNRRLGLLLVKAGARAFHGCHQRRAGCRNAVEALDPMQQHRRRARCRVPAAAGASDLHRPLRSTKYAMPRPSCHGATTEATTALLGQQQGLQCHASAGSRLSRR